MAQLGHTCWTLCIGIWNVGILSTQCMDNISLSGREGYPGIRTVDHWLGGDQTERYPQSRYADNNDHRAESDMISIA
jgi:hypothetical protein